MSKKTTPSNPIPGSRSSTGQKPPSTGNRFLDAAAQGKKVWANPRPRPMNPAQGGSRHGSGKSPPTKLDTLPPAKSDPSSFAKK